MRKGEVTIKVDIGGERMRLLRQFGRFILSELKIMFRNLITK